MLLNIYILLKSSGQRPQPLYLKDIFPTAHASLSAAALNACHNSLLWFIKRVELLTHWPHSNSAVFPYPPGKSLFTCLPRGSVFIWTRGNSLLYKRGEGKENDIFSSSASIDDFEWKFLMYSSCMNESVSGCTMTLYIQTSKARFDLSNFFSGLD